MSEHERDRTETVTGRGRDEVDDDRTHEMDRDVLPTGELPALIRDESTPARRMRPFRFTIKVLLLIVIAVFLLPGVLSGFRQAIDTVRDVNPGLLFAGFVLQLLALLAYSLLTRATLGPAGRRLSLARIFRIQLSTKALSNIVPGGNAASTWSFHIVRYFRIAAIGRFAFWASPDLALPTTPSGVAAISMAKCPSPSDQRLGRPYGSTDLSKCPSGR